MGHNDFSLSFIGSIASTTHGSQRYKGTYSSKESTAPSPFFYGNLMGDAVYQCIDQGQYDENWYTQEYGEYYAIAFRSKQVKPFIPRRAV